MTNKNLLRLARLPVGLAAVSALLLLASGSEAGVGMPTVKLRGSQVSEPNSGAFAHRGKFGVTELPVSASCSLGSTVGRVRVTSLAGTTGWKHLTPRPQKRWQGSVTLRNVALRRGTEARHLCPPGQVGTQTRALPYEVEWECPGGKGRREERKLTMKLRCDQRESRTRVKPAMYQHWCSKGFVIKGTNKTSIMTTKSADHPSICRKK